MGCGSSCEGPRPLATYGHVCWDAESWTLFIYLGKALGLFTPQALFPQSTAAAQPGEAAGRQ